MRPRKYSKMDTSKLKPHDPRVKYETKLIRGKTYSYILGEPEGPKVDTIVLVHGWPDLAFGWRHQIPYLMSLGYQVVAPNMLGYAGTDAPEDLKHYSYKSVSDDLAELARHFVGQDGQIVLGGHDWGGAVVWRTAFYHPKLVKAVFSVCTPAAPMTTEYTPSRSSSARDACRTSSTNCSSRKPSSKTTPPLLDAAELEYYVEQYSLQKAPELRGPLNWYRTREINAKEEIALGKTNPPRKLEQPALFIAASKDTALPPAMSQGMEAGFKDLTRGEVDATHWALTQAGPEVNELISNWLTKVNSAPKL
ncbi:hypothetical protein TrVFT333_008390 [Trichoderma virens FT-333]|nr:hypothetical protein TrVFT333_008390 [Trichoderma virens FT-333]